MSRSASSFNVNQTPRFEKGFRQDHSPKSFRHTRRLCRFSLSPGQAHDAPQGHQLIKDLGPMPGLPILLDHAYEGNETRQLVLELGMLPVVPPKFNRLDPWHYDRALYRIHNEIERLFRRLKGYRRIFSGFEKLDCVFSSLSHRRRGEFTSLMQCRSQS
jgi:transposase